MKKILKFMLLAFSLILVFSSFGGNLEASAKTTNLNQTKQILSKHYRFYRSPTKLTKASRTSTAYYLKRVHVSKETHNKHGYFYKVDYQGKQFGWIKRGAFYTKIYETCNYRYKLTINSTNTKLYSAPASVLGAKRLGTVKSLKLSKYITGIKRDDLNNNKSWGYISFKQHGKTYWVKAQAVKFRDLNALKGNNKKVEKAIATGLKLVGKSPYNWGGGRNSYDIARRSFDCSSFIHYIYAKAGVRLGNTATATTYSEVKLGKKISYKNMKRGDIFFFTAPGEGVNCHVAIYLGNHLFLHDSPASDTGGVGVSSLLQKEWKSYFNYRIRRVA